ncbi:MAG: ACP S-malonyltransferase [Rhodospirillaceae bacterium]|jgi:[acyl-carrier-protein] S-malonyltransferase|nr:ACP S-malonyltransferase [Rhodospirillaceae bacterium]MBT5459827.1 ACP S-malonyltransferase [Rhodospirillaceae bacterium]
MARAFVFPGQGSQAVGMGQPLAEAFPIARHTFEEIDDALNQGLSRLMLEGPEDELTLTENAQPALMAVSLAVMRVLESEGGLDIGASVACVAGHSLGEYSALTAAGSFTIADTARLLKTRGRAMQEAVPLGAGGMAALIGTDLDGARALAELAAEGEVCSPANDNAPDQVVLSGTAAAIDRAVALAPDQGIKRAIPLQVSAPFHCSLMAPAAAVMEEALSKVDVAPPLVPLIANVTASPVEDPDTICRQLVEQVTGMVRWRECVLAIREREIDTLVEIGSGKVLSGLTRRIDRELTSLSVGDPDGVEAFLKTL